MTLLKLWQQFSNYRPLESTFITMLLRLISPNARLNIGVISACHYFVVDIESSFEDF